MAVDTWSTITGPAQGEAWLEVAGLVVKRGDREVLRDVNATLRGSAVGLVGENGAGKSTLIATMLGVLRASSGTVRVLGEALPGGAMEIRRRTGVMAEQAGVFPGGSSVDAVAFAGALSGLNRSESLRRAHRALDALGAGEERYRTPDTLSTGMRQTVKLAMCLVHDPELLVLDEPTVGLDPDARGHLLDLIRALRDQGRRILISTHILSDAEGLCDEFLLLRQGQVLFSGTADSLAGGTSTQYSVRGSGLGDAFGKALAAAGVRASTEDSDHWVIEAVRSDSLVHVWRAAAAVGGEIRSLHPLSRSLEDAIVDLMGGDPAGEVPVEPAVENAS